MFDCRFGCDRECVCDALCTFDRTDQGFAGCSVRDPPNVLDRFDLGDADSVGTVCDGGQIIRGEWGAGGVDPHPRGVGDEGVGDVASCLRPVVRRDRVFEVEYHGVGAGVEDLAEQLLVVAGGEQVASLHYSTPFSLSSATYVRSSPSDSW